MCVQAVFSRASLHKLLKGILKYDNLRYATDAAHCGHFSAQLMKPLMEPAQWSEFVQEECDDPKYPAPLDLNPHVLSASREGGHKVRVVGTRAVVDTTNDLGVIDVTPDEEETLEESLSDDDYFIFT